MSDASTTRMIAAYMEEADAPLFLSGFFQSPPRNFHTSEKVEIDIQRDNEEVAIAITDVTSGARLNTDDPYQNKSFTPVIFDEAVGINAYNMLRRRAGNDPFADVNIAGQAMGEAFRHFRKLERKVRRAIELMASQTLQTGVVSCINAAGTVIYTLDFGMRSSHKVTAGTAWAVDGTTGDPLSDLNALSRIVRTDGKKQPTDLVFGRDAFMRFLKNPDVQKSMQLLNLGRGSVANPKPRGEGAVFQGYIALGHYQYNLWTYDGYYKHPQTGTLTDFIDTKNVLMLCDGARYDLSYGAIPMITAPDQRAMPFLPPRMSSVSAGLDLTTNAWVTADGKSVMVSAGTRPLTIPTAIDTYACFTAY